MDDLISRQAAIDAMTNTLWHYPNECYRNLNEYEFAKGLAELGLKSVPSAQPEPKWIPVSERLPEKETVLATVETKTFKYRYVCEAVWIPRWTWKADFDFWEDCSEYNEDEDEYYVLEGWYERVHNWDEYSYVGIEDNVIAWQPLPEPYREEGGKE